MGGFTLAEFGMLTVLATAFMRHGAHPTLRHPHGKPVVVLRLPDEIAAQKSLVGVSTPRDRPLAARHTKQRPLGVSVRGALLVDVKLVRRKRLAKNRATIPTPTPQAEPFSPCHPQIRRNRRVTGSTSNLRRGLEETTSLR